MTDFPTTFHLSVALSEEDAKVLTDFATQAHTAYLEALGGKMTDIGKIEQLTTEASPSLMLFKPEYVVPVDKAHDADFWQSQANIWAKQCKESQDRERRLRARIGRMRIALRQLNKAHAVLWKVLNIRAEKDALNASWHVAKDLAAKERESIEKDYREQKR